MEVWKDIVGYEGLYQVSNQGKIRSVTRTKIDSMGRKRTYEGQEIKVEIGGDGYLKINLYGHTKRVTRRINRLVAEAFIPNPENKPIVNHINGDKLDNRVENLEWCTIAENVRHAYNTGLAHGHTGQNNGMYNKGIKVLCITTGEVFANAQRAGEKYHIPSQNIQRCCKHKKGTAGKLADGTKLQWKYYEKGDGIIEEV